MKKKLLAMVLVVCVISMIGCGSKKSKTTIDATLTDVATALTDAGVVTGEQTETFAQMIGATDGFKYSDSGVEVYEYDIDSDEYKQLKEKGAIELEILKISLTASSINGQYVLFCEEASNKDDIVSAFSKIK